MNTSEYSFALYYIFPSHWRLVDILLWYSFGFSFWAELRRDGIRTVWPTMLPVVLGAIKTVVFAESWMRREHIKWLVLLVSQGLTHKHTLYWQWMIRVVIRYRDNHIWHAYSTHHLCPLPDCVDIETQFGYRMIHLFLKNLQSSIHSKNTFVAAQLWFHHKRYYEFK